MSRIRRRALRLLAVLREAGATTGAGTQLAPECLAGEAGQAALLVGLYLVGVAPSFRRAAPMRLLAARCLRHRYCGASMSRHCLRRGAGSAEHCWDDQVLNLVVRSWWLQLLSGDFVVAHGYAAKSWVILGAGFANPAGVFGHPQKRSPRKPSAYMSLSADPESQRMSLSGQECSGAPGPVRCHRATLDSMTWDGQTNLQPSAKFD